MYLESFTVEAIRKQGLLKTYAWNGPKSQVFCHDILKKVFSFISSFIDLLDVRKPEIGICTELLLFPL